MIVAVRSVDLEALASSWARLDPVWLLLALTAFALQIPLAARRWRCVAATESAPADFTTMLRWTAVAQFFNQTLPTTIGGDAVRAWFMVRAGRKLADAVAIVFVDRVIGVSAILMIVAVAIPVQEAAIPDPLARSALNLVTFAGIVGLLLLVVLARRDVAVLEGIALLRPLRRLLAPLAGLQAPPGSTTHVLLLSLLIHALTIGAVSALAQGFQLGVGPAIIAVLVPPVLLVSMVPLSIAGWGLREMAMVTALGFVGVGADAALSVSLTMGVILLLVGAPGGLLWALDRPARKAGAIGLSS